MANLFAGLDELMKSKTPCFGQSFVLLVLITVDKRLYFLGFYILH